MPPRYVAHRHVVKRPWPDVQPPSPPAEDGECPALTPLLAGSAMCLFSTDPRHRGPSMALVPSAADQRGEACLCVARAAVLGVLVALRSALVAESLVFSDRARDGVGLFPGLQRNGIVRRVRAGSVGRFDRPFHRVRERVRLSGFDTVEHDLLTLDNVIQNEMPD